MRHEIGMRITITAMTTITMTLLLEVEPLYDESPLLLFA